MMDVMRVALLCLLLLLVAGCAPPPAPPDPALWGSLKPGPYAVGFGLRWESDSSRTYGVNPDGTKKPRPIPVGVWYPARPSPSEHMQVADYFDMRSKQVQFDELATRLNAHIRDGLAQNIFGKAAWSDLPGKERAAADRLFAMRTSATFDAPPSKGQFPVVIYNPGEDGGYEEDFVLFEYLAAHGYVVLSTSYHCPGPGVIGDCGGAADMRDMYFLYRFATLLGNTDAPHVAAMGHGSGGAAALTWALEADSPLDAAIGFDPSEQIGTSLPPVATLLFAVQPSETLRAPAPHHGFVFAGLQHDDFITTGILREAAQPHRQEYDRVCRLTLLFLDAYLKKNPAALGELQQLAQSAAR